MLMFSAGKTLIGIFRSVPVGWWAFLNLPFLQESRHAFGMRALGLPNTKHFHEITRIEDALARELWFPVPSRMFL